MTKVFMRHWDCGRLDGVLAVMINLLDVEFGTMTRWFGKSLD